MGKKDNLWPFSSYSIIVAQYNFQLVVYCWNDNKQNMLNSIACISGIVFFFFFEAKMIWKNLIFFVKRKRRIDLSNCPKRDKFSLLARLVSCESSKFNPGKRFTALSLREWIPEIRDLSPVEG